jgi:D-alanine-D-alanine ligase
MKVALLHDRKPEQHTGPDDQFEEFDSPETIEAISQALAALNLTVEPVINGRDLPQRIDRGRFDFVFNIAEGSGRRCREAVPAAVCELLGIPYTGSDPLTLAATLDKAIARRIVTPEVPVARATLSVDQLDSLRYPVIVKPNDEGSSKGIRRNSYCADPAAAQRQARWLTETYSCPILVEEWLPGPEVTVAVAGNGASARILAMMEIGPATLSPGQFLYSLEVKRAYREQVIYTIPPSLPDATLKLLEGQALTAYRLLGCRDIARLDFRLDSAGLPRFLECNPLPGLNPDSGDLVIATRSTIAYPQLIRTIMSEAAARYGLTV